MIISYYNGGIKGYRQLHTKFVRELDSDYTISPHVQPDRIWLSFSYAILRKNNKILDDFAIISE